VRGGDGAATGAGGGGGGGSFLTTGLGGYEKYHKPKE